jgi:hypothetical protein
MVGSPVPAPEQSPDERAAFEAAAKRVRELTAQMVTVGRELREADRAGDPLRMLDAIGANEQVTYDLARAVVEAGRWGDTTPLGFPRAWAVHILHLMGQHARRTLPLAVEGSLTFAFLDDDDPLGPDLRETARSFLVRLGLVTEHELDSFPRSSVSTLVWQRYETWLEANPL